VPGSDPTPQAGKPVLAVEDTLAAWGDATSAPSTDPKGPNDDQLRRDKPPHWG
jgi:hypothetical protein